MQNVYLGRQPILDADSKIRAYEILYRDSSKRSNIHGDRQASASVITNVLNRFGAKATLGDKRAFVKIDEKFLLNDLIFSVPDQFFVFALLESVEMTERVIERIHQLYEKNYVLVINDIKLDDASMEKYREIFPYLSFIKVDFSKGLSYGLEYMILELKSHNVRAIATKIENARDYNQARKLGCDWFQGYFFAEPKILQNVKYEPTQMNVLNLYNLLIDDTNLDDITTEFENNPEITVQLLQFINSGAFHFQNKISSIHHVLTLVGRKPLAQWLMLMIYSKSSAKSKEHTPLMLMIKSRTELMESILKTINPEARSNMLGEAYLVGVLSLIDVVFGKKMEDILENIHISDVVKNAILNEGETLGEIYKLVKGIEAFDTDAEAAFETRYGLEEGTVKELIVKSIEETNKFENSAA
ncbi:MAG: EAL domain-containing protein [Sulfurimonas sp.]|nr:EAL domain-containing protein [Sulfurimonas sp.]